MARRSLKTPAVIETICAGLSAGTPMEVICREEGMPAAYTVREWINADPEVAARIAEARDHGEMAISYRCRETARGKGESTGDVKRDKLIIDTDLKLLAKWNPRKWGDRLQHANDPDDPMPATEVVIRLERPD